MIIYINIQKIKFIVLVLCVLRKQETKESVDIKWGGNYARNLNYKIVDLKKLIDMDEQELEFIDAPGKGEKRKNDW